MTKVADFQTGSKQNVSIANLIFLTTKRLEHLQELVDASETFEDITGQGVFSRLLAIDDIQAIRQSIENMISNLPDKRRETIMLLDYPENSSATAVRIN